MSPAAYLSTYSSFTASKPSFFLPAFTRSQTIAPSIPAFWAI